MRNTYLIRGSMRVLALAILGMFSSLRGYGQITGYTFTNSLGTYTAISGGTTVGNSGLQGAIFGADPVNPISDVGALTSSYFGTAGFGAPIGFDFKFGARTYTTFQMSTDGYIKLGGIVAADAYPTIITGSSIPVQFAGSAEDGRDLIAAFGSSSPAGGLGGQTGSTMKYITTGSAPNRVCTIEWAGVCRNGVVGDNFNFQIKLYETSNKFEIVYGSMTTASTSTVNGTAGAVGRLGTDFKKVGNTLTTTTMEAPVLATTNVVSPFTNERVQWRIGFMPSSGRTYTFDPAGSVTCFMPVKPVFTVNGDQVDISWGAASGATSYNVEYRNVTASGTFAPAPGGTGLAGTSLSITGLTAANQYEFRVQSNCSGTDWISATRTIPGPGEICSLAIPYGAVAANQAACTPTTVSAGLGNDGTPTISCGGTSVLTDKWYSFVAPANGKKIIIETSADGASNPDWALEVYSSCGGSAIVCADDFSASDYRPVGELCQFDYVAGQTYYVRLMQMAFYGSGPTINLCIYEDVACPVVPVNNNCASASVFSLQPFGDCPANQAQFTTENATATAGLANPTCAGPNTPLDVWVTFNSGTNTAIQLSYTLGTATGVYAQIYSGTCGGLVPVASTCYTGPGSYAVTGLIAATDYYVRFFSINSTQWGTFNVCLNEPPTCPTGLGAGYVDIGDIGGGYTSGTRTTCGKDNDVVGGLLNQACGSNNYLTGEDEVFKFSVPSTGLYQVVLASNSSWVGMKIFANCPLLGQGGACVANVGSSTGSKNISNITLTAGIDYYLVVDQFAPPSCISSYEFSIGANPAPPANDNCAGAVLLTQSATCNYNTFSYAAGATTSTEPVLSGANDDDVWYKFIANTIDPEITITPSPGFYPVIEFFTACGTTPICGAFNGGGAGLPVKLTPPVALTIGQTYYFRVFHAFSGSPLTDDYDVCVTNGPGEASCVDVTGFTAEAEACGTFTNTAPAFEAIAIDQTIAGKGYAECNYRDFDYYKITTTQAGYLTFTLNSEFPVLGRIFANSGSAPGAVIETANSTAECAGNIAISFPTSQPAGTYWLLVAPQNFDDVGCASTRNDYLVTATFTVNPPLPEVNDNCNTPVTLIPCGPAVNNRTLSATQSYPATTCAGFASDYAFDLWYKFTANTSLHTISAIGNQDGVLQAYLGGCGGSNLACSDATGAGGTESITLNTVVGQTYFVRWYVYTEGSQPPPANVSIRVTTPGGWSGLTSNDWAVGSNWCEGTVPGVGTNVTIPNVATAPTVVSTANCNNITLLPGATLVTTPNSLNVKGNLAGNGNTLTGTSPVIFSASLNSQSVLGNVTFTKVRNSNTNPGGLVFAAGSDARVKGVMTVDANTKTNINASGKLTISSDASGDGSIGVVGSGATFTGNVNVERYLPFGTTPGWHFIGSPVTGNTFSGWTDDIELRATAPLGGTEGVTLMTGAQHATVFQYNEPEHNVRLDTVQKDGWRIPTGAGLTAGKGFRVFMSNAMLSNNYDSKIDNSGSVTLGNAVGGFTFPTLNRNEYSPCNPSDPSVSPAVCNEENRGWNLIANPFPSAINWDAAGWNKPAQMNNAFFLWDGVAGGYRVYVGTGGVSLGVNASTNANPNLIPTGQAFFVKLTTAGTYTSTLKADESVKSSGAASFVRTATASNSLRMRISKVGSAGYDFDAMVRFMDGATDGFDQNIDANFMRSNRESVAFRGENQDLILNTLPSLDGYRVVPVRSFYSGQTGQFKFNFLELASFPASVHIYLKDRVLNSIVDIRQYPSYTFNVAANNNLNSNDRFELVFSPTAITEVKPAVNGSAVFSLYPNPSNGNKVVASMIGFDNESNVLVTVTDVMGKVVYTASQAIGSGNNAEHEISARLAAGIYNVSCVGKNHKFTTKLVVE